MKKLNVKMLIAGVLVASTLACFAAPYEDLDTSVLRIDGVEITSSAAEINIMDGVTSTASEINQLGVLIAGTGIDNLTVSNVTASGKVKVTGTISNTALTASKPVFTDSDKVLVSTGTLAVEHGGSGATTLTSHGIVLGAGASAVTILAEATDGQIPIGDTGANPVLATITGTADEIDVSNGAGTITIGLVDPLGVAKGGSGAATFTDGGLLVGATAGAFEVLAVGTDGQALIGASSANPGWQTITGLFSYNASGVAAGTAGYVLPAYDASAVTNIGDAAIVADSITSAKMATAVQTSLGLADTAAQAADVWGAPTATPSPTLLVNAVTIQAKTAAGGDLSAFRLIRVWTSETSMGAASTNNIETLVMSTGTPVDEVVAHADYRYVTATDGSALATITGTATGTNYVMVSDGSSVSATAITFIP